MIPWSFQKDGKINKHEDIDVDMEVNVYIYICMCVCVHVHVHECLYGHSFIPYTHIFPSPVY